MPPFKYEAFVNPYIGSISELMGRGDEAKAAALIRIGEIQAREAEQRGQAWAGAIEGIGKTIGAIPGQMQAQKEQAFKAAQQARMVKGQQQDDAAEALFNKISSAPNTMGITSVNVPSRPATLDSKNLMPKADGTMELRDNPGAPATLASRQFMPTVTNPSKRLAVGGVMGLDLWDIEALGQQFAAQGLGLQGQKYLELMRGSNDDMEKHHASAMDLVRKSATRALQTDSYDMMLGSTKTLMQQLENNKVVGREDLDLFNQQLAGLDKLPEQNRFGALQGILRNISGVPEEEYTLNLGDVRKRGGITIAENLKSDALTLVGPPFARTNPKTGKPELMQRFSDGTMQFVGDPVPLVQPAGGFRFLKGSKGDVIEWPTTQRAPEGYRPYDAVAERQAGASDGAPSLYALERETRTLASVDELLLKVNRFTVGYGSLLDKVPESDANAFASELQTLKANIAFNELTAMREASKTGGALGNVSNIELALLESALGALNTRQKPEQMIAQLEKIKASITRWRTARVLHTETPVVLNPSDDAMNAAAAAMIAKAKAATKPKEGK